MNLFKEFLLANKKYNLIEENDIIIVGFSGGPDSVFLMEMLLKIKEKMKLKLYLVHINHLLRGEMAEKDEEFSCEYAKKNSLEIFHKKINIKDIAKNEKKTLEEVGREERYKYFKEIYDKVKATKIATAHNKDDQIETFLFKLMRGSSLQGLEGIREKNSSIIRPISEIYKNDILKYLDENKIKYRIDETNFENNFTRNSIRLDLIPFIEKKYNSKFKDIIFALIEEIRENNLFFNISLADFLDNGKININTLSKLSSFYIKKILALYLEENNVPISRNKIREIEKILFKYGMKKIDLSAFYWIVKDYNYLYLEEKNKKINEKIEELDFNIPTNLKFNNYLLKIEKVIENKKLILNKNNVIFDLPENSKLKIRYKRDGDRIKLIGLGGKSKKLKEIFINDKISKDKRDKIPVILYNNEIIWITGIRKAEILFDEKKEKIQRFLFSVEEVSNWITII